MRQFQAAHALNLLLLEYAMLPCGLFEHIHCSIYKSIIEVTSSSCQLSRYPESHFLAFRNSDVIGEFVRADALYVSQYAFLTPRD